MSMNVALTAESISRTLRSSISSTASSTSTSAQTTSSVKERLHFAQTAWNLKDVFVPGKAVLLLEWISSSMLKSLPASNKQSQQQKKNNDASSTSNTLFNEDALEPYLRVDHFTFLHTLLLHFSERKSRSSIPRLSMAPIFSGLLTSLTKTLSSVSKVFQKPWITHTTVIIPEVSKCFDIITSSLSEYLNPSFEQHVQILADCLDLVKVLTRMKAELVFPEVKEALGGFVKKVLLVMLALQKSNANQKKVFTLTLTKLLQPSLTILLSIRQSTGFLPAEIADQLHILVKQGLFHKEHLLEFASVLQQMSTSLDKDGKGDSGKGKKEVAAYPKQLFDRFEAFSKDSDVDVRRAGFFAYGMLMDSFIEARRKHLRNYDSNVTFSPDFTFFRVLLRWIKQALQSSGEEQETIELWRELVAMLVVLQKHDVYKATQDEVSKKQLVILKDLFSFSMKWGQNHSGSQGIVYRFWSALIPLEYTIITSSLQTLWPWILSPLPSDRDDAVSFLVSLVQTFSKSRQLDDFLDQLIEQLTTMDLDELKQSTIYENAFADAFAGHISQTLPSQTIVIINRLATQLTNSSEEGNPTTHKDRRVKVDSGVMATQANDVDVSALANKVSIGVISMLFTKCAESMRVLPTQKESFENMADTVLLRFVKPVYAYFEGSAVGDAVDFGKRKRKSEAWDQDLPTGLLAAAMSVHLGLMEASHEFWVRNVATDSVLEMLRVTEAHASVDPVVAFLRIEMALFHADRVASTSVDPRNEAGCSDIVNVVMNSMTRIAQMPSSSWDRSVLKISEANLSLAIWCSILDHISPICHIASNEQVQLIVDQFLTGFHLNDVDHSGPAVANGLITRELVALNLVKSTAFYELKAIRDVLLPRLIVHMKSSLAHLLDTKLQMDKQIDQQIKELESRLLLGGSAEGSKRIIQSTVNIVNNLVDLQRKPKSVSLTAVKSLFDLLSVLNHFPTSYFSSFERDVIVCMLVLVDLAAVNDDFSLVPKSEVDVARSLLLKLAAVCRKITARFIKSREDVVITLHSAKLLLWFIGSSTKVNGDKTNIDVKVIQSLESSSLFIYNRTVRKLLQQVGLQAKVSDYVKQVLDFVSSQQINTDCASQIQISTVKAIVEFLHSRRSKLKSMVDETTSSPVTDLGQVMDLIQSFATKLEEVTLDSVKRLKESAESEVDFGSSLAGGNENMNSLTIMSELFQLRKSLGQNESSVNSSVELLLEVAASTLTVLMSRVSVFSETASLRSCGTLFSTICKYFKEHTDDSEDADICLIAQYSWFFISHSWRKDSGTVAMVTEAMAEFCSSCTARDFQILLSYQLDQLEVIKSFGGDQNRLQSLLHCIDAGIVSGLRSGRRGVIRRTMSRLLSDICYLLQNASSYELAIQCFMILLHICEDKILEMSPWDLSIILTACTQLATPTHPLCAVDSHTITKLYTPGPDDLFDILSRLLLSLLSHRRDSLVQVIPSFVSILRGLLHCFRGPAAAHLPPQGPFHGTPFRCLRSAKSSLSIGCAESLSRIFEKMNQKTMSSGGSTGTSASDRTALHTAAATTVRPFAKHAPYILAELVAIQASRVPLVPRFRTALEEGIYALLDLSGEFGRRAVLAGLDALHGFSEGVSSGGARNVFKELVAEWEKNHTFKGKV
ncbi:rRNA primary transcript metabolism protein [Blyttiomyces sp. JEL0837]|nr:rRNA primary transcript metabolism protein [Blyttiomyces sp. JEL0837]